MPSSSSDDPETAPSSITFSPAAGPPSGPPDLRFLHFNDVYHVDASSAEPVGGVARFQGVVDGYRRVEGEVGLLTFFSGDAFNPSLESSVTKGSHMVPVLNGIGTDCACVGNHDFDFGITQFRNLTSQCRFPWLLANVLDPALGPDVSLANAPKTHLLTSSNGIKVGLIGLAEKEWLETINSLPPNLQFVPAAEAARKLVPELRDQGAEIVIALTHQRDVNDEKLAAELPGGLVDVILGGHDHFYAHKLINGTHVLRSGSDFKQLSYIEAWRRSPNTTSWDFRITRRNILSSLPPDPATTQLVATLTSSLKTKLSKPVGYTAAPLDARFTTVRLRESNLGNFVTDLMRYYYAGDACIMAAGTIRGDQIYGPGVLRCRDLLDCFPFEDPVVVVGVTGRAVLEALENAVCKYPALEGRFPQVSALRFAFDPEKPPMERITEARINGGPIEMDRKYRLVTRGYMARGKDGFTSLLVRSEGGTAEEIVSEENGVLISMMLRQYFMGLKVLRKWRGWGEGLGRAFEGVREGVEKVHGCFEPKGPGVDGAGAQRNGMRAGRETPKRRPEGAETPVQQDGDEDSEDEGPENEMESVTMVGVKSSAAGSQNGDPTAASQVDGTGAGGTGVEQKQSNGTTDEQTDRELLIMRRVLRKWWRLTGLKGHPGLYDELGEGEFVVNWTRAIAPRLEGRIRIVGV